MNQPNKKSLNGKIIPHGVATRRLYDGKKLKALLEAKYHVNLDACINEKGVIDFNVLCMMAFDLGISKAEFKTLLETSVKKQFAGNFLWKFLRLHFNFDLAVPFITGYYTTKAIKANLIVNSGHKIYADLVGGTNSQGAVTAMAYGTGTSGPTATDTTLGTEVARAAATITNTTTTTTGDTEQWVHTFTAAGPQAIIEEGLLDNNSSGGRLLARQVFSAVNMVANDTIQFTHKIQS